MSEAQIFYLLIRRDRLLAVIVGIAGFLITCGASYLDVFEEQRALAIAVGFPGLLLIIDYYRRRDLESHARQAAFEPKSVVSARTDSRTPLLLRFTNGDTLTPTILREEALQIVAWLQARNPELEIDNSAIANASERQAESA